MYSVYILQSSKDNKYYIGQTNNLSQRIERHNAGMVLSTKSRRPLKLIYSEDFVTRSQAVSREKELKSFKGGDKFKKLLAIHAGVV